MRSILLSWLGLAWCGGALLASAAVFPPAAALPLKPDLPDPLVMFDGREVKTAKQWVRERRPELKALFQHYMYGHLPPAPRRVRAEVRRIDPVYFGGRATLKEITLRFGGPNTPSINLLLVVPNHRRGPAPVVLGLSFCGNHTVLNDPLIPLPVVWMPKFCAGCTNNVATEAGRGAAAADWSIEAAINRGYAIATFYNGDLEPDRAEATEGIRGLAAHGGLQGMLRQPDPAAICPACPEIYSKGDYDWSTIGAWAWGLQRAVDYLVTDRSLDRKRIAVFGHSRNGKTALLAGAFDERIGLVLCHQAGCGGSAPSRGQVGEQVRQINGNFPYWFNAAFKQFNEQTGRLPFDQHELIALCAPRPVLLSNATDDQWANPAGQFDMLHAATPVYRLLGAPGIEATQLPAPGQLVPSRLGYYLRPGKHSTTSQDWEAFLDFADAQWGTPNR